ncbi:MAG: class I SAM-dependent methyltransferase, partial [Cyanobacteriota bacterium]
MAPDIFWWRFNKIYRYINTKRKPDFAYDWVVIHKGMVDELPRAFVKEALRTLSPALANEVFVILGPNHKNAVDQNDPHLTSLTGPLSRPSFRQILRTRNKPEPVLPEPGEIFKFSQLSSDQLAKAMDDFWLQGGYVYSTLRDQTYYAEIDRYIKEFIGAERERVILDLACGTGRLGNLISKENQVIGVDISEVAVAMARRKNGNHPHFCFEQMDAHELRFQDQSFDIILFIDAIEHVLDVGRVFTEMSRVLKPGGLMMATVANRDSVNQILTTKLGNPEFLTNYQHIREFSYQETLALLHQHGFDLERSAGIFLYPYWGVPGVDAVVRQTTDEDPEFVELMRVLGERVGAEYAYCSVILARKQQG